MMRKSGILRKVGATRVLIFVAIAAVALVACNPTDVPVTLGSYAGHDVVTSMSASGRYVLIGTHNRPNTTAGTGQLILVDRDVDGSGTLDTSGNTSTKVLFGSGGWATGVDGIDNASMFTPAISPDGSMIAFEADRPNDSSTDKDCLYFLPTSDAVDRTPHSILIDNVSCSTADPIFEPDWMTPVFSDSGHYLAYTNWKRVGSSTITGCPVVRMVDTVAKTDNEISTTYDGQLPSLGVDCGQSLVTGISGDGRFTIFQSTDPLTADQIASGQSKVPVQVYAYDQTTGNSTDISALTNGDEASLASGGSISGDGRFVAFVSRSSTLTPSAKALGTHPRVFVLDRDVNGSKDQSGNLVVDQAGNTAVVAVSDGTVVPHYTHVGDSVADGSGNVHVGPVAWSETGIDTGSAAPAMLATEHGPKVASAGSGPGRGLGATNRSKVAPVPNQNAITRAGASSADQPATTMARDAASTTTTPATRTPTTVPSKNAPPTSTQGGPSTVPPTDRSSNLESGEHQVAPPSMRGRAGRAVVDDVALSLGAGAHAPKGTPLRVGTSVHKAETATVGGTLSQIEVADLQTGQVAVTSNSGNISPYRTENYGVRFELSQQGNQLSYSVLDSSGADSALVRAVVYPLVADPASTFGFRPYGAYVSDPVNVATGSFTNQNTDITAHDGVYGLDWTRTYNSADPQSGALGTGWATSFSSAIYTQPGSALVRYDDGRQVIYTDSGGTYTAPAGDANSLTHNGDGTWSLGFPSGEHWDYNADGVLQKRTSADGQTVTVSHDANGEVSSAVAKNAAGATDGSLSFAYDGAGQYLTGVTAADGRAISYTVSGDALDSVTDVDGHVWQYATDSFGRITSEVDPSGVTLVTNVYDDNGRVYSQTVAGGTVTKFVYDAGAGTATVTDAATNKSLTYAYDKTGNVTKVTDPLSKNATNTYTNGYLSSATDRNGVTFNADYDSAGNLLWFRDPSKTNSSNASDPNAGRISYTYDSQNRPLTETSPSGAETVFAYTGSNPQPDSITVKDSGGATVAQSLYSYDGQGRVTQVTDPDGIVTTYSGHNAQGEPGEVTVGGRTTAYTYDAHGNVATEVDPAGYETDYTYNGSGQELTKTGPFASGDSNPIVTSSTYDDAGRLLTTTGPAFQNDSTKPVTTNTYNAAGQLVDVEGPDGEHTSYTYDTDGRRKTTTDPLGGITSVTYGDLGRVSQVADPLGLVTSYGYDNNGQRVSTASPAGATTSNAYDAQGHVVSRTVAPTGPSDPAPPRVTTNAYDTVGRMISVTDPTGAVTTTDSFDALDRPTKTTNALGGQTATTYTPSGKVASTKGPDGRVTTNSYDSTTGDLLTVTGPATTADSTPPITHFTYDADGRKTSETSPTGDVTHWTYDASGNVATETLPDGVKLVNTWDARGDLLSQARERNTDHAVYSTVSFTYDLEGHLLTATDAKGGVTSFTYDAVGHRLTETDPADQGASPAHYSKQWSYDADGNLLTTTDGLGRVTTDTVSSATGLVTGVADPTGRTVSYGYDFAGEPTSIQYAKGSSVDPVINRTYDADGRVLSAEDSSGSASVAYNAAGQVTSTATPAGRTARYGYDNAGRRTTMTTPDGRGFDYAYDADGHIASVTPQETVADTFTGADGAALDPAKWTFVVSTKIEQNAARLQLSSSVQTAGMISYVSPTENSSTRLTYQFADTTNPQTLSLQARAGGASGMYQLRITSNSSTAHLVKVTDAGVATDLATFTVPVDTDAHNVRFEVNGSTVSAKVWPAGSAEPSGWDASATDSTFGGTGYELVVASQSGTASTSVSIDNFSQTDPSNPPAAALSFTYDASGRMTGESLPSSGARSWSYTDGRLTGFDQTGVGTAVNDTLSYDPVGRLESVVDGSASTTYDYDVADELTGESKTGSAPASYTYDANGNRASQTLGSTSTTYTYDDAGELTSTSAGASFTYDGAGRRLSVSGGPSSATYGYDHAGRLDSVSTTDGSSTTDETRSYGPLSHLLGVANTTGSSTTSDTFDWDLSGPVPSLDAVASNGKTTDLLGVGATLQGGTVGAVGTDAFGSVTSTPGASGLACGPDYDAFGVVGSAVSVPCVGYRGTLTASGLVFDQARNYDPATGAFLSTDPVAGVPGTATLANEYTYGDNNPVANMDPTGLYAVGDQALMPQMAALFYNLPRLGKAASAIVGNFVHRVVEFDYTHVLNPVGGLSEVSYWVRGRVRPKGRVDLVSTAPKRLFFELKSDLTPSRAAGVKQVLQREADFGGGAVMRRISFPPSELKAGVKIDYNAGMNREFAIGPIKFVVYHSGFRGLLVYRNQTKKEDLPTEVEAPDYASDDAASPDAVNYSAAQRADVPPRVGAQGLAQGAVIAAAEGAGYTITAAQAAVIASELEIGLTTASYAAVEVGEFALAA